MQPFPPLDWQSLGIDTKGRSRGSFKTTCPKCSHTRRNKTEPCLSVDLDKNVFHCFHCDWRGPEKGYAKDRGLVGKGPAPVGSPLRPDERERPKLYRKPEPPPREPVQDRMMAFFSERGISADTVHAFGIYQGTYTTKAGKEIGAICFPYRRDDEVINIKYRFPNKRFAMESGAELTFYNLDRVQEEETVIICEGEMDVLALYEAGYTNVISPPNGAPSENTDIENASLEYMASAEQVLKDAKRVILAGDMDSPGQRYMDELARRIGKGKCWKVRWPDGCKDANDVLLLEGFEGGASGIKVAIDMAEPYPVDGITTPGSYLEAIWKFRTDQESGARITIWPEFSKLCRFSPGQLSIVTGVPSSGKALALDTPIPTPEGWKAMGDLRAGDRVFDEHGQPCNVVGVTPVWRDRPTYRVGFSDGTHIVADGEHEWFTSTRKDRRSAIVARKNNRETPRGLKPKGSDQSHKRTFPGIKTTREIAETIHDEVEPTRKNHQIAATAALDLPDADLPIPPYTLGAWLGDGHSHSGMITNPEEEIVSHIRADGYRVTSQPGNPINRSVWGLIGDLREAGLLRNKHIPTQYLRASTSQRWSLLQGLMDTDGYATKHGTSELTLMNRRLADDAMELVRTLGGVPTMSIGRATIKGEDKGEKYRVRFHLGPDTYRLDRKRERCRVQTRFRNGWVRTIVSCDLVESVPTVCIQVDSDSHLFLAGEAMIPTHNSVWLNSIILDLAVQHGWNVGVFSPEYFPKEIHVRDLVENLTGKVMNEKFKDRLDVEVATDNEVRAAVATIDKHINFILPPEPTLDQIVERAQTLVYRNGIKMLVVDPWTEIDHPERGSMSMTDWVDVCLKRLRRFGREYGVHVVIVAHPKKVAPVPGKDGNRKMPVITPYDISDSRHWFEMADNIFSVYRDKSDPNEPVQVHVQKVRFRDNGDIGLALFKYDKWTRRYRDVTGEMDAGDYEFES